MSLFSFYSPLLPFSPPPARLPQLDLEDTCLINLLHCHLLIMRRDFWKYSTVQASRSAFNIADIRWGVSLMLRWLLHWVSTFSMSCPSRWAWKVENLGRRREVLSEIPSPSWGEGSIYYLDEPRKRKSLRFSMMVGPTGLSVLSRLIYLSPYSGLSPFLKLVFWALVLEPSSHSFPPQIDNAKYQPK